VGGETKVGEKKGKKKPWGNEATFEAVGGRGMLGPYEARFFLCGLRRLTRRAPVRDGDGSGRWGRKGGEAAG